jgi:hypothetical protein
LATDRVVSEAVVVVEDNNKIPVSVSSSLLPLHFEAAL